ncbi:MULTISPECIES: amidohydrolase [Alteromonadaceae]|uniref:amidohydrolase n=1 Tax=Alteromonadaceae TaxID=72275 RepID=UPI001C089BF0|nr:MULTISPECIES: amidohydrolase [Aliiglaciecola]MBU2878658.1 amidohydrolase [Aliiglaciecola lipolytica]MDO6709513.1 amidohydrolase [Aliiglaciecola sp. 2_MG-2023]MDO6750945.1 amidohydrolase [Aliiglaciecola sp. 1_MG-2023]
MKNLLVLLVCFLSFFTHAKPTMVGNVKGYTLNNDGAMIQFSHIVFENGKVISIGDQTLMNQYPDSVFIDGRQKTLLPGLIDAHGHLLYLGYSLLEVDLRDVQSAQLSASKVGEYAAANSHLEWIIGGGWNQVLWPDKQFPKAQLLDEYVNETPVILSRVDGHAVWVNSKAMQIAGIDKDTLDPPGGKIIRDEQGNPSGVLIDTAMDLLSEHLPEESNDSIEASLEAASQHLLSVGITNVHDAGISKSEYDFFKQKALAESLAVRIYAMFWFEDPSLQEVLEAGYFNDPDDFLSIRSVKAMADGALGSRGAALFEDYSDAADNKGLMVMQEAQFKPLFDLVLKHKFQLNVHAIGDLANHLALNQFEASFKTVGGKELRNRVEHAQVISLNDIPRFKQLDIIPSMQPTHATSDMNMAEDRLGKDRLRGAYAWKRFIDQGSPLPLGSDFPVELANPFYGIHAAVTRQDRNNQPVEGWIPSQALSLQQAFKGFTIDAAYAAHQEKVLGGLTKGKWADFILIDQDIFEIDKKELWKTNVVETWVAGKRVYENSKE